MGLFVYGPYQKKLYGLCRTCPSQYQEHVMIVIGLVLFQGRERDVSFSQPVVWSDTNSRLVITGICLLMGNSGIPKI
jgi:hypothetical protein